MPGPNSKTGRTIFIIAAIWLLAALIIGHLRLLEHLPRPVVQLVLFALTGGLLLAFWKIRSFHDWIYALPLRALILYHVVRFVGIYFLVLYRRGELPYTFAVPGGWGDISIAVSALLISLFLMHHPF